MPTFVLQTRAFLKKQTNLAPKEYIQFTQERALWENFGWTYNEIMTKPKAQVDRYLLILQLIDAEREEEVQRAKHAAKRRH